jgi:hypothetical protein
MNVANLMRHGAWGLLGGALAIGAFGTTASLSACGDSASCTRLRNDTNATKQIWGACDPDAIEPCIKVFGNVKDCTGVLSCDFAVNPVYREQAEQAVQTIAGESQGCYQCATPNCVEGDYVWCEPITRQCLVVTGFSDGGILQGTQPPVDAGPPEAIESGPTSPPDATPDF